MTVGRIPSVEGGIQPTLLTAKGDLISATAASTVARLAVGTNNQILVADSTASTGLKWATPSAGFGTLTSYTPVITNWTLGNGTVTAKYSTSGNITFVAIKLLWGSTSAITGRITISLPVAQVMNSLSVQGWYLAATENPGYGIVIGNTIYCQAYNASGTYLGNTDISSTIPTTWTTGSAIVFQFCYESA